MRPALGPRTRTSPAGLPGRARRTGVLGRLRPTTRGTGLASVGGALAVAGVLLGVPALVQVGLMALLVVVAGVATVSTWQPL